MIKPVVSIKNIHKRFGPKVVLDGVSLDIYKGEIIYIIGKSGTGKSVMLKNITGLMKPDKGEIFIYDKNIITLDDRGWLDLRKKMGVLFQMAALFDSMSVFENVAFTLRRFTDKPLEEIRETVKEKLRLVGLSGVENLRPSSLSGGMQKRVGLARAIALEPEIVLYDEPTTGVDPILASAVDEMIRLLNKELKVTSIVISHDMKSVFRTAHRVAMLYDGNFILVGTPQEFKENNDPVVKQFVEGRAEGPIPIL